MDKLDLLLVLMFIALAFSFFFLFYLLRITKEIQLNFLGKKDSDVDKYDKDSVYRIISSIDKNVTNIDRSLCRLYGFITYKKKVE